jgi:hypothetical protein
MAEQDEAETPSDETEQPAAVEENTEPEAKPKRKARKQKRETEVRFGAQDSDTVREVQEKLGLEQTGDYDATTMRAVQAWQNRSGFVGGRGIWLNEAQLSKLLGSNDLPK